VLFLIFSLLGRRSVFLSACHPGAYIPDNLESRSHRSGLPLVDDAMSTRSGRSDVGSMHVSGVNIHDTLV
jgi:hypothetical protein